MQSQADPALGLAQPNGSQTGGSFGMFARLAQVVYTVTRSAEVDEVVFSVDGEMVTVFSAEGIELNGA